MPAGRYWTSEELEWLETNYELLGCKKCAEHLNRTVSAVSHKAERLKCYRKGEDRLPRIRIKCGYLVVSGYQYEIFVHRAIAEQKIGRKLREDEVAHHIDGNKLNNDPSNIKVVTRAEHLKTEHVHPRDEKGKFIG